MFYKNNYYDLKDFRIHLFGYHDTGKLLINVFLEDGILKKNIIFNKEDYDLDEWDEEEDLDLSELNLEVIRIQGYEKNVSDWRYFMDKADEDGVEDCFIYLVNLYKYYGANKDEEYNKIVHKHFRILNYKDKKILIVFTYADKFKEFLSNRNKFEKKVLNDINKELLTRLKYYDAFVGSLKNNKEKMLLIDEILYYLILDKNS